MQAIIHAADVQDRDGGVLLMGALFGLYPFLLKLYADSGYRGAQFQAGLRAVCGRVNLEIVKRSDRHKFVSCRLELPLPLSPPSCLRPDHHAQSRRLAEPR